MTDAITPHEHGCRYTFEEIQRHFKADLEIPWEIVRQKDRILGLRLRSPVNSDITSIFRCVINTNTWKPEVWVGTDSFVIEWGLKLSQCRNPLHLYLAPNLSETYNYEGLFTVLLRQSTSDELAEAESIWQLKRPISKIIYLESAP